MTSATDCKSAAHHHHHHRQQHQLTNNNRRIIIKRVPRGASTSTRCTKDIDQQQQRPHQLKNNLTFAGDANKTICSLPTSKKQLTNSVTVESGKLYQIPRVCQQEQQHDTSSECATSVENILVVGQAVNRVEIVEHTHLSESLLTAGDTRTRELLRCSNKQAKQKRTEAVICGQQQQQVNKTLEQDIDASENLEPSNFVRTNKQISALGTKVRKNQAARNGGGQVRGPRNCNSLFAKINGSKQHQKQQQLLLRQQKCQHNTFGILLSATTRTNCLIRRLLSSWWNTIHHDNSTNNTNKLQHQCQHQINRLTEQEDGSGSSGDGSCCSGSGSVSKRKTSCAINNNCCHKTMQISQSVCGGDKNVSANTHHHTILTMDHHHHDNINNCNRTMMMVGVADNNNTTLLQPCTTTGSPTSTINSCSMISCNNNQFDDDHHHSMTNDKQVITNDELLGGGAKAPQQTATNNKKQQPTTGPLRRVATSTTAIQQQQQQQQQQQLQNLSIDTAHSCPGSLVGSEAVHLASSQIRFCKLIRSRRKAAKMLLAVVIMFGLCYLPVHLINTLRCTVGLPQNDLTTIASLVSHWLCYFNSAINPIIYNIMNSKFRREFGKMFACFKCFHLTATNHGATTNNVNGNNKFRQTTANNNNTMNQVNFRKQKMLTKQQQHQRQQSCQNAQLVATTNHPKSTFPNCHSICPPQSDSTTTDEANNKIHCSSSSTTTTTTNNQQQQQFQLNSNSNNINDCPTGSIKAAKAAKPIQQQQQQQTKPLESITHQQQQNQNQFSHIKASL